MAWGPLLPLLGGQAEKSSGIWGSAGYLGESGACRGHGRGEPRPQAGPDLASEKEYLLFGITCVCVHVRAKLLQLCPTLCDPMDCSPPGSPVHGILQAGTLEWAALPSSRASSRLRDRTHVSCIAGRQILYC